MNQPGANARMEAPTSVTQRRPDNRITVSPMMLGRPITNAITASGRIAPCTSTVDATPASRPIALPTSKALASSHGRGSGITLYELTAISGY